MFKQIFINSKQTSKNLVSRFKEARVNRANLKRLRQIERLPNHLNYDVGLNDVRDLAKQTHDAAHHKQHLKR